MPLFCRHNRFEHSCPICSKEKAASRRPAAATPRTSARRPAAAKPRAGGAARPGALRTRRLARAEDDGYRHPLAPGLKATEDAERLAGTLAWATERLEFPGPYSAIAEEEDIEQATWLAFLLALTGPDQPQRQEAVLAARPRWGEPAGDPEHGGTIDAYRTWVARAGTQEAAFRGEPMWKPERRFARVFDRLALPGFGRGKRFELLSALGAAGRYELAADALHFAGDDATTTAAKRALNSGDVMLLERRARELADGVGVPLAALDRGLALWDSTAPVDAPEGEALERVRAALALA